MKPRIRKKGSNTDGSNRYALEYLKKGKLISISLNPTKLIKLFDMSKSQRKVV